jgi:hypothetical protein
VRLTLILVVVVSSQGVGSSAVPLFRGSLVHVASFYDSEESLGFLLGGGAVAALTRFVSTPPSDDAAVRAARWLLSYVLTL